ncbi:MAG: prephenate dehydrogenase dimerization domain-containing protein [Evtepia gabavorous]
MTGPRWSSCPRFDDIRLLDEAKKLLAPVGFGRVSITTAQEHDKRIAFTSQMAHVISNAYIKSPTARNHDGFSAGSYKDLTRVAWLNPAMWAELFLENRENLLFELDTLIRSLEQYREAIQEDDFAALCQLLEEGRRIRRRWTGHDHRHGKGFPALRGYHRAGAAGHCGPAGRRTVEGSVRRCRL